MTTPATVYALISAQAHLAVALDILAGVKRGGGMDLAQIEHLAAADAAVRHAKREVGAVISDDAVTVEGQR